MRLSYSNLGPLTTSVLVDGQWVTSNVFNRPSSIVLRRVLQAKSDFIERRHFIFKRKLRRSHIKLTMFIDQPLMTLTIHLFDWFDNSSPKYSLSVTQPNLTLPSMPLLKIRALYAIRSTLLAVNIGTKVKYTWCQSVADRLTEKALLTKIKYHFYCATQFYSTNRGTESLWKRAW